MFNFFKKSTSPAGKQLVLKLDGMHCTTCSLNIDGALEETKGVLTAITSYARQETKVEYDPKKVTPKKLAQIVSDLGYTVSDVSSVT
ncbi:MAG TPA: heavy metal-associated domain-containing protein [Vitreimonas sp.]|nr:heavy metal-associated domain-containing protein [Vitreimonas sp.]